MVMVKENSEPHVENMLMRKRMMVMVMVLVILMENSEPDVDEEGDDGDGDAVHGDDGYGEEEQRAPCKQHVDEHGDWNCEVGVDFWAHFCFNDCNPFTSC